ncbi:MAG: flavin reductase family protein [Rhodocyclaceae bacterium]
MTTQPHRSDHPDADGHAFRRALGMFATGITVVTARAEDGSPVGLTVNSFNSVSLHPPLVVWSLSNHVGIRHVFEHCSHYAVNVLAHDQESVSRNFAGRLAERFAGMAWHDGTTGVPLLDGCCAHFEVRNTVRHAGGDHTVFVGEVERFEWFERDPLVYFRGHYRQLAEKD